MWLALNYSRVSSWTISWGWVNSLKINLDVVCFSWIAKWQNFAYHLLQILLILKEYETFIHFSFNVKAKINYLESDIKSFYVEKKDFKNWLDTLRHILKCKYSSILLTGKSSLEIYENGSLTKIYTITNFLGSFVFILINCFQDKISTQDEIWMGFPSSDAVGNLVATFFGPFPPKSHWGWLCDWNGTAIMLPCHL